MPGTISSRCRTSSLFEQARCEEWSTLGRSEESFRWELQENWLLLFLTFCWELSSPVSQKSVLTMFLLNLVFHNNKDEKIWSNSNNVSKSEEMVSSFLLVLDVYSRGLVISWISAGVQPSLAYLVQYRIAQPHLHIRKAVKKFKEYFLNRGRCRYS